MTYYIEHDFPIEKLNPQARRGANAKRPIAMLHKWWARRLGCVFCIIILASLISVVLGGHSLVSDGLGQERGPAEPCRTIGALMEVFNERKPTVAGINKAHRTSLHRSCAWHCRWRTDRQGDARAGARHRVAL